MFLLIRVFDTSLLDIAPFEGLCFEESCLIMQTGSRRYVWTINPIFTHWAYSNENGNGYESLKTHRLADSDEP